MSSKSVLPECCAIVSSKGVLQECHLSVSTQGVSQVGSLDNVRHKYCLCSSHTCRHSGSWASSCFFQLNCWWPIYWTPVQWVPVSGMKVLELGCGFGALADLMATEYGVEVTGVTLSEEIDSLVDGYGLNWTVPQLDTLFMTSFFVPLVPAYLYSEKLNRIALNFRKVFTSKCQRNVWGCKKNPWYHKFLFLFFSTCRTAEDQHAYAKKHFKNPKVDIRLQDYRSMSGQQFDRIYSVGIFEHIGRNCYEKPGRNDWHCCSWEATAKKHRENWGHTLTNAKNCWRFGWCPGFIGADVAVTIMVIDLLTVLIYDVTRTGCSQIPGVFFSYLRCIGLGTFSQQDVWSATW